MEFDELTKKELDINFLNESVKKARKALIMSNIYKNIFIVSSIMFLISYLYDPKYLDYPILFICIMIFSIWVIRRNIEMYRFCVYLYEKLDE